MPGFLIAVTYKYRNIANNPSTIIVSTIIISLRPDDAIEPYPCLYWVAKDDTTELLKLTSLSAEALRT